MGMPVHGLHAPSVPSVASAPVAGSQDAIPLPDLVRTKENLEAELTALGSVLESHGVTMATTLTTFDGFPRADIDVAQIRTTRARIIHLRNDWKQVMAQIETRLHEHFATQEAAAASESAAPVAASSSAAESSSSASAAPAPQDADGPPFAIVNSVAQSSPAADAGLVPGDRLVRFGDADWMNHEKLAHVAQIVGRSEGRAIAVRVLRARVGDDAGDAAASAIGSPASETVQLTLVPRNGWGGRGLLGCHLLPL